MDAFLQNSLENVNAAMPTPLREGQKVFGDRFILKRFLGQGGMGVVWLAQDAAMDQPRALKFVLPQLVADAAARKRLRNEARLGTELAHPRIVRVFDFVEDSDGTRLAAVVMEYVEGRTLSDLLAERDAGFFEPEDIETWVQDVTQGLSYAHEEKQRFHLDLKPANIIIETKTNKAKLLDFGISRSAKETLTRLTGQMSSGTLPYMSPQQLDGESPSASDDVYGLGATIYELLTGTAPFFRGKIDDQIRNKIPESMMDRRRQNAREGLIESVGKEVPAEWEKRVVEALAKQGHRKFPENKISTIPAEPTHPSPAPQPPLPSNDAPREVSSQFPTITPNKARIAQENLLGKILISITLITNIAGPILAFKDINLIALSGIINLILGILIKLKSRNIREWSLLGIICIIAPILLFAIIALNKWGPMEAEKQGVQYLTIPLLITTIILARLGDKRYSKELAALSES